MPNPDTTRTELDALVRVSRAKLVDQVNDTNVDAQAIVDKLEVFVLALIAQNIDQFVRQITSAGQVLVRPG